MSTQRLNLSRAELATFLKTHDQIKQFESLFTVVDSIAPDVVSEVSIAASSASSLAAAAIDATNRLAAAIEMLALAPVPAPDIERDNLDYSRPIPSGTMADQDSNNVLITGGTISCRLKNNQTILLETTAALTNSAAAAAATLLNSPVAGNPTKWVAVNDNGTTRYTPLW